MFFYDLGDPECYLTAELITGALAIVPEWEPVVARRLSISLAQVDHRDLVERLTALGLQPLRWPDRWPFDTERVTLAATYAKRTGRAVAFSLAAFRQAFAGGRDLAGEDTILIAAAACEMHPAAVLKGMSLGSIQGALEAAHARAAAAGITKLPAILTRGELFEGAGALQGAARAVGARG